MSDLWQTRNGHRLFKGICSSGCILAEEGVCGIQTSYAIEIAAGEIQCTCDFSAGAMCF